MSTSVCVSFRYTHYEFIFETHTLLSNYTRKFPKNQIYYILGSNLAAVNLNTHPTTLTHSPTKIIQTQQKQRSSPHTQHYHYSHQQNEIKRTQTISHPIEYHSGAPMRLVSIFKREIFHRIYIKRVFWVVRLLLCICALTCSWCLSPFGHHQSTCVDYAAVLVCM